VYFIYLFILRQGFSCDFKFYLLSQSSIKIEHYDTRADGNTYTVQIQLIKKLRDRKQKPFIDVKMCQDYDNLTADAMLPPSTVHNYLWLSNADGAFELPPPSKLTELIARKLRNFGNSAISSSVLSMTDDMQSIQIDAGIHNSSKAVATSVTAALRSVKLLLDLVRFRLRY
jgi:hypothetical protein